MASWYSYNRLLSYNIFMNMVMSPRGNGKSYGAKKIIIENYLKNRKQSVYVRRTKTELDGMKDKYWDDIAMNYPDLEFSVKGYQGFINGDLVLHFIPLSTSSQRKSDAFPHVTHMFFDEYVITKTGHTHYLRNEMVLLLDLIETVFRKRTDSKVILMSNAVSYVNPLFDYYGIEPNPKLRFQRFHNKSILLELFTDSVFIQEKLETPFGKLIANTPYGNYAINNEVLEDTKDFLRRKKGVGYWCYMCEIKTLKYPVACWIDSVTKDVYIDDKIDSHNDTRFTILVEDSEEGYLNIKNYRHQYPLKTIRQAFNEGKLFYKNQSIKKHVGENIIRYI